MTPAAVVVSAEAPDAFEIRQYEGPSAWRPAGQFKCAALSKTSYLRLRRVGPGAGFVLNCGPGTVHVTYRKAGENEFVGPTTDYLLPGQFREIGGGAVAKPGVEWALEAA